MKPTIATVSAICVGSASCVCCYAFIRLWRRNKAATRRLQELLEFVAGEDARIVITGTSSGIGHELAKQFAKHPKVSLLIGNPGRVKTEREERVRAMPLELLDFNSVERFAREAHKFLSGGKKGLRLVVNNAGAKWDPRYCAIARSLAKTDILPYCRKLDQGTHLSATWQINFLGPFLLTEILCHLREKENILRPLRVVNVASASEHESQLNDEVLEVIGNAGQSTNEYADAKRALLLWTSIRAQSFAFRSHVFVHASNPGKVDTQLGLHWIPPWLWLLTKPIRMWRYKSVEEGALSCVAAGLRPEATYKFGEYLSGEKLLEHLVVWRMPEKRFSQILVRWADEITALDSRCRGQPAPEFTEAIARGREKLSRAGEDDRWSSIKERRSFYKAQIRSRSVPAMAAFQDSTHCWAPCPGQQCYCTDEKIRST